MSLSFTPITMDKQAMYLDRFAKSPQKASDYSFANIWGWAEEYGLEWYFGDSHVWIRQTRPTVEYWAPVGPWESVDWTCCPSLGQIEHFIRVPETLALAWKKNLPQGTIELKESRGHWDYIYSIEELSELKGNRFHKKKNLLNQFLKKYDFQYMHMQPECVEEVLQMQEEWVRWREVEDSSPLMAENHAIGRVMKDWDRIPGLFGGAIHVDGHMVAYTVAEELSDDSIVIHFEKGKPGFKGVYQAINNLFLSHDGPGFDLVNREQDLDDPGLRKAKLSYNPVGFLKKFEVFHTLASDSQTHNVRGGQHEGTGTGSA